MAEQGSRADLLIAHPAAEEGQRRYALGAENGQGVLVQGIEKLSQLWQFELLTERGTIPDEPQRGTELLRAARRGQLRTTVDAEQAFRLAATDASDALRARQPADAPADESLDRTELLNLEVTDEGIRARVRILSEAGEEREIRVPVQSVGELQ